MLKRIALLGAMAALTVLKPSNAVAQGWDGWGGGISVNVRVPFPRRDFCCERRFVPRPVFCCERPFIPRRVFCCDDRRFFHSRFDCCDDRRFFDRRFRRDWDGDFTDVGFDE